MNEPLPKVEGKQCVHSRLIGELSKEVKNLRERENEYKLTKAASLKTITEQQRVIEQLREEIEALRSSRTSIKDQEDVENDDFASCNYGSLVFNNS